MQESSPVIGHGEELHLFLLNPTILMSSSTGFQTRDIRMSLKTAETSSQTTVRVVTFPVGTLILAVPIQSVYRVLSQITIHGSGEKGIGVAHLEDCELTVFDLEYYLLDRKSVV